MRAFILLMALMTTACAVSPNATPYPPPDAQQGMIDAPGPGPGEDAGNPDAQPVDAGDIDAPPPMVRAVGWPEPFLGTQIRIPGDTLFAFRLPTIDKPVSLEAWGLIPDNPGDTTLVRMALYSDDINDRPGTLINWTDAWPAMDREHPANGTTLGPGVYWLVVNAQAPIDIGNQDTRTITGCPKTLGFATPFQDSYGAVSGCMQFGELNVYILVRDRP